MDATFQRYHFFMLFRKVLVGIVLLGLFQVMTRCCGSILALRFVFLGNFWYWHFHLLRSFCHFISRLVILRLSLENPTWTYLKNASVSRQTVSKFQMDLNVDRRQGSGRKISCENTEIVKNMVASYSKNPAVSNRKMAQKMNVHEKTIRKIKADVGKKSKKFETETIIQSQNISRRHSSRPCVWLALAESRNLLGWYRLRTCSKFLVFLVY